LISSFKNTVNEYNSFIENFVSANITGLYINTLITTNIIDKLNSNIKNDLVEGVKKMKNDSKMIVSTDINKSIDNIKNYINNNNIIDANILYTIAYILYLPTYHFDDVADIPKNVKIDKDLYDKLKQYIKNSFYDQYRVNKDGKHKITVINETLKALGESSDDTVSGVKKISKLKTKKVIKQTDDTNINVSKEKKPTGRKKKTIDVPIEITKEITEFIENIGGKIKPITGDRYNVLKDEINLLIGTIIASTYKNIDKLTVVHLDILKEVKSNIDGRKFDGKSETKINLLMEIILSLNFIKFLIDGDPGLEKLFYTLVGNYSYHISTNIDDYKNNKAIGLIFKKNSVQLGLKFIEPFYDKLNNLETIILTDAFFSNMDTSLKTLNNKIPSRSKNDNNFKNTKLLIQKINSMQNRTFDTKIKMVGKGTEIKEKIKKEITSVLIILNKLNKSNVTDDPHYTEYLVLCIYIIMYMLWIPLYYDKFNLINNIGDIKDSSKIKEMNEKISELHKILEDYTKNAYYKKYEIKVVGTIEDEDSVEQMEMFKEDIIKLDLEKLKNFKIEQSVPQGIQAGGGFLNLYKKKYMKYKEKYLNIKKNFK